MEWVFDASVTMAWCFDDESTPRTEELLDNLGRQGAAVLGHWALEVGNVLTLAMKSGRISLARRIAFIRMFDSFSIHIDPETHRRAWTDILHLADTCRLTSYDAAYLELAMRLDVPLATDDEALKRAAKLNDIPLL